MLFRQYWDYNQRLLDDEKEVRLNVGENTQNGVFAGAGVDVDGVTGEPGEDLGLGVHLINKPKPC